MNIIENSRIKEKAYIEKLENGMKVIIIPKANLDKKYIIWGTHFGSIDNRFIMPKTGEGECRRGEIADSQTEERY